MSVLDMFRLSGNVAIVTGAHAWLGYDIACALAEAGSEVVVTSRESSRARDTAAKIHNQFGVDTLGLEMDQRRFDSVKTMAEKANAWKGHIDILVNNAGGGSGKSEGHLLKRNPEDEIDMITTNLIGVLFCCKEAARVMVKQGHGKIINIASNAGLIGRDRRLYQRSEMKGQPVDYAAAKGGVIALTRDLAGLLSPSGVYVNCISPGGFDKGGLPELFTREFADRAMLGRWGRMGIDIKGAALFLASHASDYVTGHNLVVDGGFSIWK
jgi:NAD(P)-dependent dehydrogenase (short-subunit alcohol dehydrogenase family)